LVSFALLSKKKNGESLNVHGAELCRALREFAPLYLGGRNRALFRLAQLKIHSSEDLGKIVFALVKHGVVQMSESDSESDFLGRFTLATLFEDE
jgi:uncharacterized repeat protein (TIGR04138 family)